MNFCLCEGRGCNFGRVEGAKQTNSCLVCEDPSGKPCDVSNFLCSDLSNILPVLTFVLFLRVFQLLVMARVCTFPLNKDCQVVLRFALIYLLVI